LKKNSFFPSRQQLPEKNFKKIKIKNYFFKLFFRVRADNRGEGGRGEGDASARTPMSGQTLGCVCADMGVRVDAPQRPRRCIVASARTHLVLPHVTSKRMLQCVQVTDAPAAIVRSSVRPFVRKRPRDNPDVRVHADACSRPRRRTAASTGMRFLPHGRGFCRVRE
jgi:hypothetical protein